MQANVLVADVTALSLVVPTASAAEEMIELADDEDVLALKDDDRLVIRTAVLDLTADENPRPSQRQRIVSKSHVPVPSFDPHLFVKPQLPPTSHDVPWYPCLHMHSPFVQYPLPKQS